MLALKDERTPQQLKTDGNTRLPVSYATGQLSFGWSVREIPSQESQDDIGREDLTDLEDARRILANADDPVLQWEDVRKSLR